MDNERLDRAKKLMITNPLSKAAEEAVAALSPEEYSELDRWSSELVEGVTEEFLLSRKSKPTQKDSEA